MAVKSILEIDVNDAKFREFKRLHDQYSNALRGAPAAWRLVNSQIDASRASFDKMVAKMAAANVQTQLAVKAQERADQLTRRTSERWASIARSTMSFAGSLRDVATSVLRMAGVTGIITGLVGGGGLWGIDRLGAGAAASRRRAMGIGAGVGPMQAFDVAFERFVDPDFLERVASGRFGLQGSVGLLGAGLSQREMAGDTAQVGRALLMHLKKIADATDPRMMENVIGALHLPVSLQEMMKLRETRPDELQRQFAQQQDFAGKLRIDDSTLRKWQDFITSLDFAGKLINKTFVEGLVPLAGPIGHLSEATTNAIATFMKVVEQRKWIDQFADGIEKLAGYIGTDEFTKKIGDFVTNIGKLADAIADVLPSIKTTAKVGSAVLDVGKGVVGGFTQALPAVIGGTFSMLGNAAMKYNTWAQKFSGGMSMDDTMRLIREREGSSDTAVSPKGAIGRYQIMPGTARQYGFDPSRLMDPAYNEKTARAIVADLVQRYHGNLSEVMAAYNAGPGRADAFRRAGDDPRVLPLETQRYISGTREVTVRVDNNTGGSAAVSVNALKN